MKIFRKKEAFIEIIMLLLLTGFIFMPGKVSAQSTCSTETRQGNGGGCESADDGDPTFIQISRRVIPCANYDKPKLELSSGSSTNILFSYDKSLITTTAEMDVISSLPDWLNIAVDSEVTDLGDPNLNFIKITFMVTANVLPNSHSEIKLRLVDEGPGETRAVKKVIITVDRTLFSQINVPAEGSLVRAEVPIFGLAYGEDFSHYTIEFGEGYDPNIWIPITTSYTPQTNDTSPIEYKSGDLTIYGNLATWETGLTEYTYGTWATDLNGAYTVRLKVFDTAGNYTYDETTVGVGRVLGGTYSGTAVSPDTKTLLIVPEQAIKEDFVVVGIDTVANQVVSIDEGYDTIGQIYEIQPPGLEFTKDVVLEMNYSEDDIAGKDESKIGIYAYNPDTGHWQYLATNKYLEDNKLTTVIRKITSGYAYYAILEKSSVPAKPVLNQPDSPTQDRFISINGTADRQAKVKISVNGIVKNTSIADDNGIFSLDILPLADGINTITAVAVDEFDRQSPESDAVTVEVIEPQITVTEINFKDSVYSSDFSGTVYAGDTLYLELIGSGGDISKIDKTSITLKSSITDTTGIEIQLAETGVNSDIYRGEAKAAEQSCEMTKCIASWHDGETITAISKINPAKTASVTVADFLPPAAPAITSLTHTSICQNTFEDGFEQWRNRNAEEGAELNIDNLETVDGTNCLKLININYGGNFASTVTTVPFDAAEYPLITFDYKITEDVKINLLVKVKDDMWYEIIFNNDEKKYWVVNMEDMAAIENIIADGEWHTAAFDLYKFLINHRVRSTEIEEVIMADWDTAGFMKLIYGTNYAGASYYVDNFMITKPAYDDTNPIFIITPPHDLSGIAGFSYKLDNIADTLPDQIMDTGETTLNYENLSDETYYFHARCVDNAGNWGEPNHYKIKIDTRGPQASSPNPADESTWENTPVTLALTDNNGAGINEESIKLKVNDVIYDTANGGLSYDKETETLVFDPASVTPNPASFSAGETVTFQLLEAEDNIGHLLQNQLSWTYTAQSPLSLNTPTNPDGENGWYVTAPMITLNQPDAQIFFHWNNEPEETYTEPITAPEGIHTLTYRVVTVGGEKEYTKLFNVAPSQPGVILKTSPVQPDGEDSWYRSSPLIELIKEEYYIPGGLKGTYCDNMDYTEPVLSRLDFRINFNWENNSPDYSIDRDTYSIMWQGKIYIPQSDTFTFSLISDDLSQLFIDDDLIIDKNEYYYGQAEGQVFLQQGYHDIQITYFEYYEDSQISLSWSSSGITGQIVPAKYLYHQAEEQPVIYYHWNEEPAVLYTQPLVAPKGVNTLYYYTQEPAGIITQEKAQEFKVIGVTAQGKAGFIIDAGQTVKWENFNLTAAEDGTNTDVSIRARTAATKEELTATQWSDYYGKDNSENGFSLNIDNNRWAEIEITLESNSIEYQTPILESAGISYDTIPGKITGTLIDEKGNPVEGAEIQIEGTGISAVTGVGGTYTLIGIPLGTNTVIVTKEGLPTVSIAVNIQSGDELQINFSPREGKINLKYDAEFSRFWDIINYSIHEDEAKGTHIKIRSRAAETAEALTTAAWSDYYQSSPAQITDEYGNTACGRWIEIEIILSTATCEATPAIEEITIE